MASPTVVNSSVRSAPGTATPNSNPVTTTGTNQLVVIYVAIADLASFKTVTAIAGGGLSFARVVNPVLQQSGATGRFAGPNWQTLEMWAAPAPLALSGQVFNVTLSGVAGATVIGTQSISGLFSVTNPWDPNGSIYGTGKNAGGGNSVSWSTSNADDLIISVGSCCSFGTDTPSGFTLDSGGATWPWQSLGTANVAVSLVPCIKSVSSIQTSQSTTVVDSGHSTCGTLQILTALTADAGGAYYGGCGGAIPLPT